MVDEGGDVHLFDDASLLGTELYSSGIGDDKFPAVTGNVVIDTCLQGFQQGGFSVVAASDDQGDPPSDSHAGDGTAVGKGQRNPQRIR